MKKLNVSGRKTSSGKKPFYAVGLLTVASLSRRSEASPAVSLSTYSVPQGQPINIKVNVSDAFGSNAIAAEDIEGMTFTFQIGGGSGSTPSVTSVDMLTGTVWAGHTSSANNVTPAGGNLAQFQVRDLVTNTSGDFINPNGLLSTITISAAGAVPGDYSLKLIGTKSPGSDSQFFNGSGIANPGETFGNGTLTVTVPEPATASVVLAGAAGIALRRGRRAKKNPQ